MATSTFHVGGHIIARAVLIYPVQKPRPVFAADGLSAKCVTVPKSLSSYLAVAVVLATTGLMISRPTTRANAAQPWRQQIDETVVEALCYD